MEAKFFPGANRRITLGSPTKQSSNGRIVFPVSMPLTNENFVGMPTWVHDGYDAVRKTFTQVDPEVQEVTEIDLAFSNDAPKGEMFAAPSARLAGASLKGFSIERVGDAEEPDVELHFKVYAPFAREFWAWIGEMAGHEVYMAFPKTAAKTGVQVAGPELPLKPAEPEKADAKAKKSGPKELAEFHAKQVN